jgi:hypothetical protein
MKIIPEPNQLTIKLEGFEQLWALKRRLQVPHFAISEVGFLPQTPMMQDYKGHLRFPGMSLPWRFLAGSYRRDGRREFWYVRMQQPGVLTITLRPGTLNYERIRITCTPEVAQSVADWWQEHK